MKYYTSLRNAYNSLIKNRTHFDCVIFVDDDNEFGKIDCLGNYSAQINIQQQYNDCTTSEVIPFLYLIRIPIMNGVMTQLKQAQDLRNRMKNDGLTAIITKKRKS